MEVVVSWFGPGLPYLTVFRSSFIKLNMKPTYSTNKLIRSKFVTHKTIVLDKFY